MYHVLSSYYVLKVCGGRVVGWLRPILVFSLSLDQAEQKLCDPFLLQCGHSSPNPDLFFSSLQIGSYTTCPTQSVSFSNLGHKKQQKNSNKFSLFNCHHCTVPLFSSWTKYSDAESTKQAMLS